MLAQCKIVVTSTENEKKARKLARCADMVVFYKHWGLLQSMLIFLKGLYLKRHLLVDCTTVSRGIVQTLGTLTSSSLVWTVAVGTQSLVLLTSSVDVVQ